MKERLRAFMYGRYGQNNLNRVLSIASLIIMLISMFTRIVFLNSFAMVLLILSVFRMLSKNMPSPTRAKILNNTSRIRTLPMQ